MYIHIVDHGLISLNIFPILFWNQTYEISKIENVWEDKILIHIFAHSYTMQARYFFSLSSILS